MSAAESALMMDDGKKRRKTGGTRLISFSWEDASTRLHVILIQHSSIDDHSSIYLDSRHRIDRTHFLRLTFRFDYERPSNHLDRSSIISTMSAAPVPPPSSPPGVRPPYNERFHPFFDEAMKEQTHEEQLREARLKWWNNGLAKCKQNPFVPIGIAATCYAMYGAVRSMRAGNSAQLQKFFRLRVGAQAFAILAMLGGGMYFDGADPIKSLGTIPDTVKRSHAKSEKKPKETVFEAPGEHIEQAADEPVKKALPKLSPTKFVPPPLNASNNSTSSAKNDPAGNSWAGETKEEKVARMTEALEAKRRDALRENERQRERLTGKVRVAVDEN